MLSAKTFFRKERDMFYKEGKEEGIKIGIKQGKIKAKKQVAKILKELGHEADLLLKH